MQPRLPAENLATVAEPGMQRCAQNTLPLPVDRCHAPDVARQLERMDVPLDEWQQGWLTAILAKRENGQYACGIGGAGTSDEIHCQGS